jgi:hypothetical protein
MAMLDTIRAPVHFLLRVDPFAILKFMRGVFLSIAALFFWLAPACADTLHLKDGSTVTGVIVGFDQNSFKVKTSYGYAVIRRDAVVSIDMSEGNSSTDKKPSQPPAPAEKPAAAASTSPAAPAQTPPAKPAVPAIPAQPVAASTTSPKAPESLAHTPPPAPGANPAKISASTPATRPAAAAPPATRSESPAAPAMRPATPSPPATASSPALAAKPAVAASKPPAPPTKPSPPPKPVDEPIREEASGNSYSNITYGFRMFKPPTWDIIEGARKTLPGAIAALGTKDQSTYLLIGTSPATGSLDSDLKTSDVKLRDMFDNYRPLGDARETISGTPAVERKFRGSIDTQDWSGVVVLFERGKLAYAVLGMTIADTDLVQIQENVIRRAISSLQFNQ